MPNDNYITTKIEKLELLNQSSQKFLELCQQSRSHLLAAAERSFEISRSSVLLADKIEKQFGLNEKRLCKIVNSLRRVALEILKIEEGQPEANNNFKQGISPTSLACVEQLDRECSELVGEYLKIAEEMGDAATELKCIFSAEERAIVKSGV